MVESEGTRSQRAGYFAGPLRRATAKDVTEAAVEATSRATARGSAALGRFLREQRQLARLSLREMARMSQVSNAYLSQVERGLHEPSIRVLTALADVLGVPVEDLVSQVSQVSPAATGPVAGPSGVEAAIRVDPLLSAGQKQALLSVYRSYLAAGSPTSPDVAPATREPAAAIPTARSAPDTDVLRGSGQ